MWGEIKDFWLKASSSTWEHPCKHWWEIHPSAPYHTTLSQPVSHLKQAFMNKIQSPVRPPEIFMWGGTKTVEIAFICLVKRTSGFKFSQHTLWRDFPTKRRGGPEVPSAPLRHWAGVCCSHGPLLFRLGRDEPAAGAPPHCWASLRPGLLPRGL